MSAKNHDASPGLAALGNSPISVGIFVHVKCFWLGIWDADPDWVVPWSRDI